MRYRNITVSYLSLFVASCGSAQELKAPALEMGPISLRPSGFLDYIMMRRPPISPDSLGTRFSAIPLNPPAPQWLHSVAHSRTALTADVEAGGWWRGYYESDFLAEPGQAPYRLRQLWGQFERGSWKILGGQAWSLLRPNRVGVSAETDLMNTIVVEPGYHVGLAGARNRQLRLTRSLGRWQAAVAFEHRGGPDFAAKLVRDGGRSHYEAAILAGHQGRRGVALAAVVRPTSRLTWVNQQIWSQGLGPDLVGPLPARVHAHALIQGLEVKLTGKLQVFGYGGLAYAGRSPGARLLRQWSAGFHRSLFKHPLYGATFLSFQFSQAGRALWPGGSGSMNYFMFALRHDLLPRSGR